MNKCGKCGREFDDPLAYGGHIAQCGQNIKCDKCDREFSVSTYAQHLKSHIGDNKCLHCGKDIVRSKKFCNRSCSASFNRNRTCKVVVHCLECNKEITGVGRLQKKYCNNKCQKDHEWKLVVFKIESTGVFGDNDQMARRNAKKYLIKKNGNKCSICGNTEWVGQPIPLVSDHVDGDYKNNKIENIRLVCGNCDMQLPTYKNKNKGMGRVNRRNAS
jgi:hypothetical protein